MRNRKLKIPELGGFQSIKLGSGVLGKTAPLMGGLVVLALVTVTMLRNADPLLIVGLFLVTVLVVCLFVGFAFWYGREHTAEALLEGGELIRYREIEISVENEMYLDLSPEKLDQLPSEEELRSLRKKRALRRIRPSAK